MYSCVPFYNGLEILTFAFFTIFWYNKIQESFCLNLNSCSNTERKIKNRNYSHSKKIQFSNKKRIETYNLLDIKWGQEERMDTNGYKKRNND